jgi:cytochrome b
MLETTATPLAPTGDLQARKMVWDLPTRFFHWTLVVLFSGSFVVALSTPEHSPTFMIHILIGLVLAFAIGLRVIWGLVGSRPSRFGSFLYGPGALIRYVKEVRSGRDQPSAGHNPGSSYAIYAMLLLPMGLVATGLLKTAGQEWAEELHAALAYGMVAMVGLHLLGLMWHTRRHRDGIALAMVDGRRPAPETESIPSQRGWFGALFVLLVGGWGLALAGGFDAATRQVKLPLTASTVQLGEAKDGKHATEHAKPRREKHDDD